MGQGTTSSRVQLSRATGHNPKAPPPGLTASRLPVPAMMQQVGTGFWLTDPELDAAIVVCKCFAATPFESLAGLSESCIAINLAFST